MTTETRSGGSLTSAELDAIRTGCRVYGCAVDRYGKPVGISRREAAEKKARRVLAKARVTVAKMRAK